MSVPLLLRLTSAPSSLIPSSSAAILYRSRGSFKGLRHPDTRVRIDHPKPEEFDKIKDTDPTEWPYFGSRTKMTFRKGVRFPQRLPIVDTSPIDIRPRQKDGALRFGGNPRTYPTVLVNPDGSTQIIPYHKPVGTIFLPGDATEISLGVKAKSRNLRRVKLGIY